MGGSIPPALCFVRGSARDLYKFLSTGAADGTYKILRQFFAGDGEYAVVAGILFHESASLDWIGQTGLVALYRFLPQPDHTCFTRVSTSRMGDSLAVGPADLLEVTLQQALQSNAMAGLVAGHLVDGVVDGIQAVLLGADSQVELALGCAELAVRKSVRSGHFSRQMGTALLSVLLEKHPKAMPHCGIGRSLFVVVDATKMPHFRRASLWQSRTMQAYFG